MKKGTRVTLMDGWLKHSIGSQYPNYGTVGTVLNGKVNPTEVDGMDLIALLGKTGNLMLVKWDSGEETYVRESHVTEGEIKVEINPLQVGDIVEFTDEENRNRFPYFYPPVGTIGKVISILTDMEVKVQWPKGTTSEEDKWFAMNSMILKRED